MSHPLAAGPQVVLLPAGRRPSPEFVLTETMRAGEPVTAVHETLAPQRLKHWAMPLMLPWRMPRRA